MPERSSRLAQVRKTVPYNRAFLHDLDNKGLMIRLTMGSLDDKPV